MKIRIHVTIPPSLIAFVRARQSALLVLLVFAAYLNALPSSFHFDDVAIFRLPAVVSPGSGLDLFSLQQTRPLTWLTFHANYLIGGRDPVLYHAVNILLHAANVILLLAVARRYLPPLPAWCIAAVFALHPLQTESVTYVFARSTLLCTHFALWAIWFFARTQYAASALMFGVSLLAKEETIALPIFLFLLDQFERRRLNARFYAALAVLSALFAAHLFYLILSAPLPLGVGRVRGISTLDYLLSQSRVLWIYLRLLVAPYDLNLDRDIHRSTGLLSPGSTLLAIVSLLALLATLGWLAWKKRWQPALWALGFFILIAPSSSIVAQADLIFEHRTYFPLVCLAIAAGFLLARLPRAALTAGIAVLIPILLTATVIRNTAWHDEKSLSADVAAKSPGKARAWGRMAEAWGDTPAKKRAYLERGLAVDPSDPVLHTDYGVQLLFDNRPAEALVHFRRAMELSGETAGGHTNLGGAYFQMRDDTAALQNFRRAVQLDPCNFAAHRNLMMFYSTHHDNHEAYRAGLLPADCQVIPAEEQELTRLRMQMLDP